MKHTIDCREFVFPYSLAIREKYGLEGYGLYIMCRNLLYLQRMKALDRKTLVQALRIHTKLPEEKLTEMVDYFVEVKALHVDTETDRLYREEDVIWYLCVTTDMDTRKIKFAKSKLDMKQYERVFNRFSTIINTKWENNYIIQRNLRKIKKEKEKE